MKKVVKVLTVIILSIGVHSFGLIKEQETSSVDGLSARDSANIANKKFRDFNL